MLQYVLSLHSWPLHHFPTSWDHGFVKMPVWDLGLQIDLALDNHGILEQGHLCASVFAFSKDEK